MTGTRSLLRIGMRHLSRHPWQSLLMVLGITLGVAVVVAVDVANASAGRAFELSTEAVAGKATHQVIGGPQGLDENVYTQIRLSGLGIPAAPVVSEYVASPQLGERPVQLLGVDPFAEPPFRDYLGSRNATAGSARPAPPTADLTVFLTEPGAVFLSTDMAARYGLSIGDPFTVSAGGRDQPVFIAGLLDPVDSLSRRALDGMILTDISTAQEITQRTGRLDRIDLIMADPAIQVPQIESLLPAGATLQAVEARSGTVSQMTAAFSVNLTALSLLALVVGMFLIYNTMTFSVVQRRSLFGTLRCLGATRQEIFQLVLGEAFLAGVLGSILGLSLGVLMGQGAVHMVTQTINDLFFVLTVRGVQVPPSSLIKGAILGLGATLLTAAPPAWEAAATPPRTALMRSNLESKAGRLINLAAWGGFALAAGGLGLLAIPTRSLIISFAGTFAAVIGLALVAPLATRLLMRLAIPLFGNALGALGRLAPRSVISSLSRTAVAVMALMVAVSVTIGVTVMISSFRSTVIAWLAQTLQGDVYISAPSPAGTTPSAEIDPALLPLVRNWPGIVRVDSLRAIDVESPAGPVHISASDNFTVPLERNYIEVIEPVDTLWERMQAGGVLVSEPLASRLGLHTGQDLILDTMKGAQPFPILGIYYDYASTQGGLLMEQQVYRQWWQDAAITAIALRLSAGTSIDATVRDLQDRLASGQNLVIRANRTLREDVLEVFDRTFAITGALQLLATIVAFIGVLSALLSLELERSRERGILRAIGLTLRQMWGLVMLETGLLGAVAGLLAMPTGYLLSLILVYIINRRSFGWTLQMQVQPAPFLLALFVSILAAVLAGIYPASRLSRSTTADSIRYE